MPCAVSDSLTTWPPWRETSCHARPIVFSVLPCWKSWFVVAVDHLPGFTGCNSGTTPTVGWAKGRCSFLVLSVLVRFRCATSFETPWQIPNISFGLCFVWLFHVRFFFDSYSRFEDLQSLSSTWPCEIELWIQHIPTLYTLWVLSINYHKLCYLTGGCFQFGGWRFVTSLRHRCDAAWRLASLKQCHHSGNADPVGPIHN